ncbi:hypothetical protein QAD02_006278 [Eretmocerus hayati]|uniref:Uncharacterized protein n=1 Tax=Eretmocerus hayati TaxID=131215 RepID=A0ACC2N1K7_9HYME|nr:hypothetical protein QAD02_006278 [Eretmocerus hayati]
MGFNLRILDLVFFAVIPQLLCIIQAEEVTVFEPKDKVVDLCTSKIYCNGELLKTIQLSGMFVDSKSFVDLQIRNDVETTLENFEALMRYTDRKPSRGQLEQFVNDYFIYHNGLINTTLPDWTPIPRLAGRVQNIAYREWVLTLNELWKGLARRIDPDVKRHPEKHSLIYVDNTFIIPGGRFTEFYYWDTFWVIKGLLLSDLFDTARGMIENFLSMVKTYGFVPNGGRVYYLMRSQPPLLIPMVDAYLHATGDWDFVEHNLVTLEREFEYWQRYKTVKVLKNGRNYTLARYVTHSDGPRPESYKEDYELAERMADPAKRRELYNGLKSGAESGWDFSARWFIDNDGNQTFDLFHISTQNILPVDLNSFIEQNARILAKFYHHKNDTQKVEYYASVAQQYQSAIEALLWNEEDGTWYDYDTRSHKQRRVFYASNLSPLYTRSYDVVKAEYYGTRSVEYLTHHNIHGYKGGIPTSLDFTSQQWDYPNAWAPLQSMIVKGLIKTHYEPAMKLAEELAFTWLKTTFVAYSQLSKMYEKYDATACGRIGGGGEYKIQDGFGWTNGVILEMLDVYPMAQPVLADRVPIESGTFKCIYLGTNYLLLRISSSMLEFQSSPKFC